jgi:hypothetical protein
VYEAMGLAPLACHVTAGSLLYVPPTYVHWLFAKPGSDRLVTGGLTQGLALTNLISRPCTAPVLGRIYVEADDVDGMGDEMFTDVGRAMVAVLATDFYRLDPDADTLATWVEDVGALVDIANSCDFMDAIQRTKWPIPDRPDIALFPGGLLVGFDKSSWSSVTKSLFALRSKLRAAETKMMSELLSAQSPPARFFECRRESRLKGDDGFFTAACQAATAAVSFERAHYEMPRTSARACENAAKVARIAAVDALSEGGPTMMVALPWLDLGPSEAWERAPGLGSANTIEWEAYLSRLRGDHMGVFYNTHPLLQLADAVASGNTTTIYKAASNPWRSPDIHVHTIKPQWNDADEASASQTGASRHVFLWGDSFYGLVRQPIPSTGNGRGRAGSDEEKEEEVPNGKRAQELAAAGKGESAPDAHRTEGWSTDEEDEDIPQPNKRKRKQARQEANDRLTAKKLAQELAASDKLDVDSSCEDTIDDN